MVLSTAIAIKPRAHGQTTAFDLEASRKFKNMAVIFCFVIFLFSGALGLQPASVDKAIHEGLGEDSENIWIFVGFLRECFEKSLSKFTWAII